MPALLVRDLSEEGKRALAIRAAENGRSQQAEAKAILEETLLPASDNFITMIRKNAQEVGGINLELPTRHAPRTTGTLL